MNEKLWRVINTIIHRPELSIRYIYFHSDDKDLNEIGTRIYCFICRILEKIVSSTTIGVTYHELKCIQKFIAYAFMRLPWIQNHIVKNLSVEGDPLINSDKLIEFGASMSVKSPSKSVVYDWESSIFNRIKNREEFKKAIREV